MTEDTDTSRRHILQVKLANFESARSVAGPWLGMQASLIIPISFHFIFTFFIIIIFMSFFSLANMRAYNEMILN
jgi:hypothetical protein